MLTGNSINTGNQNTLYGYIKQVSDLATTFEQESATANDLLAQTTDNSTNLSQAVANLSDEVIKNNQVPNAQLILEQTIQTQKNNFKNKILSLIALINTNQLLLASSTDKTVNNIWLEEGSIIFRSVITNPSKIISQKVPIKLYLPAEIKKEQVIKADPQLSIEYDTTQNSLVATGEITLNPQETQTFLVEVEDIWKYDQTEIDSLKKQADDLLKSLKNSSFFAQGTSLASDIAVSLDKIMLRQKQAITPESRIRTYRESRLEMDGIGQKINTLKQLVTQASANNSVFGFVGGVQAIAVWGLIIILVAGFVFLTLYMRTMRYEQVLLLGQNHLPNKAKLFYPAPLAIPKYRQSVTPKVHPTGHRFGIFIVTLLSVSGLSSVGSSLIIHNLHLPQSQRQTLGVSVNRPPTASPSAIIR